jgi:hypothetical protein
MILLPGMRLKGVGDKNYKNKKRKTKFFFYFFFFAAPPRILNMVVLHLVHLPFKALRTTPPLPFMATSLASPMGRLALHLTQYPMSTMVFSPPFPFFVELMPSSRYASRKLKSGSIELKSGSYYLKVLVVRGAGGRGKGG